MAKVLVAEDNVLNFELVRDVLVAGGHSVDWSRDGVETLEKLRAATFDLLLLDLHMPRLDGLQVLREVRGDAALRKTKVVVISADAMTGVDDMVRGEGADGYLSKPLDIGKFVIEVDRQLAG